MLHYMVGSKEGVSGVSRDVIEVLSHSGLMKKRSVFIYTFIK